MKEELSISNARRPKIVSTKRKMELLNNWFIGTKYNPLLIVSPSGGRKSEILNHFCEKYGYCKLIGTEIDFSKRLFESKLNTGGLGNYLIVFDGLPDPESENLIATNEANVFSSFIPIIFLLSESFHGELSTENTIYRKLFEKSFVVRLPANDKNYDLDDKFGFYHIFGKLIYPRKDQVKIDVEALCHDYRNAMHSLIFKKYLTMKFSINDCVAISDCFSLLETIKFISKDTCIKSLIEIQTYTLVNKQEKS